MEIIGIMEENNLNNCITINFPEGSGGHMLGRMLASCDNVAWYDHDQNGEHPWLPYNAPNDEMFSRLHFNKRFAGAAGMGEDPLRIPPVLSLAESRGITTTTDDINNWKKYLHPHNFIYTLHEPLDKTKEFFKPAKHIVICPDDINLLIKRWMNSSYYYYRDPKNKSYLSSHYYKDKASELGISFQEALRNDFEVLLDNFKNNITEDDIVINDTLDILDFDKFTSICNRLDLHVNQAHFEKVKKLFIDNSHL